MKGDGRRGGVAVAATASSASKFGRTVEPDDARARFARLSAPERGHDDWTWTIGLDAVGRQDDGASYRISGSCTLQAESVARVSGFVLDSRLPMMG